MSIYRQKHVQDALIRCVMEGVSVDVARARLQSITHSQLSYRSVGRHYSKVAAAHGILKQKGPSALRQPEVCRIVEEGIRDAWSPIKIRLRLENQGFILSDRTVSRCAAALKDRARHLSRGAFEEQMIRSVRDFVSRPSVTRLARLVAQANTLLDLASLAPPAEAPEGAAVSPQASLVTGQR